MCSAASAPAPPRRGLGSTGQTIRDVQISGSMYVEGLTPSQLIARGQISTPPSQTYYAVSIVRGLDVQLLKVINGKTTVLGSLATDGIRANLGYGRLADGSKYVASRRIPKRHQPISRKQRQVADRGGGGLDRVGWLHTAAGYAGVNRPASYIGRIIFDNISLVDLTNNPPPTPPDDSSNTPVDPTTG